MTVDFSGRRFRLVPGLGKSPRWLSPPPGAVPLDSVVAAANLARPDPPTPIVIDYPNRWGGGESLSIWAELARDQPVFIRPEPYLLDQIEFPEPLQLLVDWPLAEIRLRSRAGERIRQAADFLRRRLRQIPRVELLSPVQLGGSVAVLLPIPAGPVLASWNQLGIAARGEVAWEGGLLMKIGWWHTRRQLAEMADSLASVMAGAGPTPVFSDQHLVVPDDLPRRQLDSIGQPQPEEKV